MHRNCKTSLWRIRFSITMFRWNEWFKIWARISLTLCRRRRSTIHCIMARSSCWTSCNSWWRRSNRHRTSFCWACIVSRDWTANAPFRVGRRCTWKSYKNFYSAPGICTSPHFPISKLRKHVAESWPNDASNCSYEIWPSFGRSRIQDEIDWNQIAIIWKRHWIWSQVISQHWAVRLGEAFKLQLRRANSIDVSFFAGNWDHCQVWSHFRQTIYPTRHQMSTGLFHHSLFYCYFSAMQAQIWRVHMRRPDGRARKLSLG